MINYAPITSFSGEFRWLSNFYATPVTLGALTFPTVENAYQAAKVPDYDRADFLVCTPSQAKKFGNERKMVNLESKWDGMKVDIMRRLLLQKFASNTKLGVWLEATGDRRIIEGNYWGDVYWGVCKGKGENMLGRLIMEIRETNRGQNQSSTDKAP